MATIKITPQELRDAASYLEERKQAILNEVASLKSKIDSVAAEWEGAAKSTFVEVFNGDMLPLLQKQFPEVVDGIGSQLKGAADAIERADEEVAKALGSR
jgi:WXG100 family type VII secretion target